jgi:hypothetical protein
MANYTISLITVKIRIIENNLFIEKTYYENQKYHHNHSFRLNDHFIKI